MVNKNGHLFVFCGDFYRHQELSKKYDIDIQNSLESIDTLVKGVVDATLATQNFIITAESMEPGICIIGGVRDGIKIIDRLLKLPNHFFPIFGLVVGYPDEKNNSKPHLYMKKYLQRKGWAKKQTMRKEIYVYSCINLFLLTVSIHHSFAKFVKFIKSRK